MGTPELIVAILGSSAVSLVLGAWLNRRLTGAKAGESEANAFLTLTKVSDELARQLRVVNAEIPIYINRVHALVQKRDEILDALEECDPDRAAAFRHQIAAGG